MNRYVIIVAGGKGLRMGSDLPKQFIPVGGKPILMHTVEKFAQWDPQARLLLVLPTEHQDYWRMLCREIGCRAEHRIITGGETRFHSVRNALDVVKQDPDLGDDDLIAVHDGVRPFVSEKVITDCFHVAAESGAAVATLPMVDSLREVQPDGPRPGSDRRRDWAVHTPQVFRARLLLRAYEAPYSSLFTDDASVVEALGEHIALVPSNRENIKITTPLDLAIARELLGT